MRDKVKYDNDFKKENYDKLAVLIPKGCKDELKQIADENGYSLSQLVVRTLEDTYFIDLHTKRNPKQP